MVKLEIGFAGIPLYNPGEKSSDRQSESEQERAFVHKVLSRDTCLTRFTNNHICIPTSFGSGAGSTFAWRCPKLDRELWPMITPDYLSCQDTVSFSASSNVSLLYIEFLGSQRPVEKHISLPRHQGFGMLKLEHYSSTDSRLGSRPDRSVSTFDDESF